MGVPIHCVNIFEKKFSIYPSFIEMKKRFDEEVEDKIISKSEKIWVHKIIDENQKKATTEEFLMYDSAGIMIYIKEGESMFFLTTPTLIKNVELLLNQLKRIKK